MKNSRLVAAYSPKRCSLPYPPTEMRATLVALALALASAAKHVPEEVEACFVAEGSSFNDHAPVSAEACLEHCTIMCGACREVTVANAADPDLFGKLPTPAAGYGALMDCLCAQKEALAAAAVDGDGGVAIMMGCSAEMSALQAEAAADKLGLTSPQPPSKNLAIAFVGVAGLSVLVAAGVAVRRRRGGVAESPALM